jgi:hypothetical protein
MILVLQNLPHIIRNGHRCGLFKLKIIYLWVNEISLQEETGAKSNLNSIFVYLCSHRAEYGSMRDMIIYKVLRNCQESAAL